MSPQFREFKTRLSEMTLVTYQAHCDRIAVECGGLQDETERGIAGFRARHRGGWEQFNNVARPLTFRHPLPPAAPTERGYRRNECFGWSGHFSSAMGSGPAHAAAATAPAMRTWRV